VGYSMAKLNIKTASLVICLSLFGIQCAGDQALVKKRARAKETLGMSSIQRGDVKGGIGRLIEAAQLDPENANIHNELALAYKNLGVYDRALVHFKKALELKPEFTEAQNNLGTLYLLMGKWDLAIACFKKALSDITYRTPHFAYNNLGLAYYGKGVYDKAIDSYRRALQSSPSYTICYRNLGLAYEAVKRWEAAIDAYQKAISIYPEYAAAHFDLGKLYLRFGIKDKAAGELKLALAADPDAPFANEAKQLLLQTNTQ
jgi:type IV pilus assembly protein PilF